MTLITYAGAFDPASMTERELAVLRQDIAKVFGRLRVGEVKNLAEVSDILSIETRSRRKHVRDAMNWFVSRGMLGTVRKNQTWYWWKKAQ